MDAPRLDAERLLGHALGWSRVDLYTRFEETLTPEQVDAFRELVRRRADREPLQHILGRWPFRTVELICDARSLTPRPETEDVVAEALRRIEGVEAPLVADVGCGGGCMAASIATERPDARVVGVDIALETLELALENVEALGLADRVRLLEGDLCAPLVAEGYGGRVDLLVSNPPYVKSGDIAALQPEVRDHDPLAALDGGADGLVFYRRLFDEARAVVKPGGVMVLELAEDGETAVRHTAAVNGWTEAEVRKDFADVARILSVRRPGGVEAG